MKLFFLLAAVGVMLTGCKKAPHVHRWVYDEGACIFVDNKGKMRAGGVREVYCACRASRSNLIINEKVDRVYVDGKDLTYWAKKNGVWQPKERPQ